jgi:hypothetical protein
MMSHGITAMSTNDVTSSSILDLLERLQSGGLKACKKRVPIVDLREDECSYQLNTRRTREEFANVDNPS